MDDNNTILKDLGELVENTKSAVKAKFSYEDVSLRGVFKKHCYYYYLGWVENILA